MRQSLESILRLLDSTHPAEASAAEFDGADGAAYRLFQRMGFLAFEPGLNSVPSCPYCVSGAPYPVRDLYVCNRCRSLVPARSLHLWRFDLAAFLRWFAGQQSLQGEVERIDDGLWRLGTLASVPQVRECFYFRGEPSSDLARARLAAFQSVLILHGRSARPEIDGIDARMLFMAEVLIVERGELAVRPLAMFLGNRRKAAVRFERRTGILTLGDETLGQIPSGSREFAFLDRLATARGDVIPYGDLKRSVCLATGSIDSRDEATFCHRLKSRIKKHHGIAAIDALIRADRSLGYVLLREAAPAPTGGE